MLWIFLVEKGGRVFSPPNIPTIILIFKYQIPPAEALEFFSKAEADNVFLFPIMTEIEECPTDVGSDFPRPLRRYTIGLTL